MMRVEYANIKTATYEVKRDQSVEQIPQLS